MASPGGTSSGSINQHHSWSADQEEELQMKMDERKRKRKESNRESARRSRMKKQQHLEDLIAQVAHLRQSNSELATKMNFTAQNYAKIEAENSVLRVQVAELSNRLQSLDEIMNMLDVANHGSGDAGVFGGAGGTDIFPVSSFSAAAATGAADWFMVSPWSSLHLNQPIMASADMFQY
ncbi:hypothetical protein Droror1_Dr00022651 [Drosera rotundifolia]